MSNKNSKKNTFISELKKEGRLDEGFLDTLSEFTIEELITLKLEVSSRMLSGKLYNFLLWQNMPYIVRQSLLNFVDRNCKSKMDMASTLGIPYEQFIQIYKKYIS
tara:strand:- start:116 stop:430 length:315 start_codon:yes stop_codon:yes gene_type:complete